MCKMIILKVNGEKEELDEVKVDLETVQKAVGGYIEAVPYFTEYEGEKCQAWCDEGGKLKGYELNRDATLKWATQVEFPLRDVLVGDIVILTGECMLD